MDTSRNLNISKIQFIENTVFIEFEERLDFKFLGSEVHLTKEYGT